MSRSMLLSLDELLTITLSLQYSIDCPMASLRSLALQAPSPDQPRSRRRFEALVFPFALRLGNPGSLALQHQPSLEAAFTGGVYALTMHFVVISHSRPLVRP